MVFTVHFDLPDSATRGEDSNSEISVNVEQWGMEIAEGDSERERAVYAAKDILYEAPAFDHLSDYDVQQASVTSVERRGKATNGGGD